MKKETYKVIHPTIKEISIGDKFVLNNGAIVEFQEVLIGYSFLFKHLSIISNVISYVIEINSYSSYNTFLKWERGAYDNEGYALDIKCKAPTLKEKINLI